MSMTAKQQTFVQEYLVDLNATQAAIRAGYSPKTAHVIGPENLGKPIIAEAVVAAMEERAERTGITQDQVVTEIARMAFYEIPEMKLSPHDKLIALDKLAKHLGMYVERREVSGKDDAPIKFTLNISGDQDQD